MRWASGVTWIRHRAVAAPASAAGTSKSSSVPTAAAALSTSARARFFLSVGDQAGAERQAALARQALPNDPLTALLQARSAEARGDRATAQRIFADMAKSESTEILGLRGLFHQAASANETEAARQYAQRAVRIDRSVIGLAEVEPARNHRCS